MEVTASLLLRDTVRADGAYISRSAILVGIGRLDKPIRRRQNTEHKNSIAARLIPRTPPCLELLHSPCATRLKSGSVAAPSAGAAVTARAFLAERVWHRAVKSVQPAFTECETRAAGTRDSHSAGKSLAVHFWIFRCFFPNLEKTFPTTRAVVGKIQDRSQRGLMEQPARDNQRKAMRVIRGHGD